MHEEIDQLLEQLDNKIDRVRSLYEQYFLGIERIEPLVPRKEVDRLLAQLQQRTLRNTAVRFKYQTLLQRWIFLQTRWSKVLREIEAGTYAPHVARARRRGALPAELERRTRRDPLRPEEQELLATGSVPQLVQPSPKPKLGTTAEGTKATAESSPIPGMNPKELHALHERYQNARGRPIKYEALLATLERQVPGLLTRLGCKQVRFEVTEEAGKVVLRARPRRDG